MEWPLLVCAYGNSHASGGYRNRWFLFRFHSAPHTQPPQHPSIGDDLFLRGAPIFFTRRCSRLCTTDVNAAPYRRSESHVSPSSNVYIVKRERDWFLLRGKKCFPRRHVLIQAPR